MKRKQNAMARKSRKINRPRKRTYWFWTTTVPNKRGWWAHVVVDTMSMPAMSPIVAFIVGNDLPPLEPACVRRLDDLGYVHDRAAICRVMDIPAMDRWSNRRLHRDERGCPI